MLSLLIFLLKVLYLLYLSLILCSSQVFSNDPDLCDQPVISSIDRMYNGTVRIYRGGYYWDISGLPDRIGILSEPKKIDVPFMAPVISTASIVSILEGNRKAYVYKFDQGKFWAWMANGYPFKTTVKGTPFKYQSEGFDTVFHNENSAEPLLIAIKGKKVYYYSTKEYEIIPSHNYGDKGYEGGVKGENFPAGVNASISWPPLRPEDGYYVFLFRGDKYCRRKEILISGQECDEWKNNRELFGCKT